MENQMPGSEHLISELRNSVPSRVRVRCPQCFQLYVIDPREVRETRPKFECNHCETRFWLPYPECLESREMIGFPLSWLDSGPSKYRAKDSQRDGHSLKEVPQSPIKARLKDCPVCEAPYSHQEKECQRCGVIFSKYESRFKDPDHGVAASPELADFWEEVITEYEDEARHNEFVEAAFRLNNLEYAATKYKRILQVSPQDELARPMSRKIQLLMQTSQGFLGEDPIMPSTQRKKRGKRPWWMVVVFLAGGVFIASGFVIPEARNMVGVGTALVFFIMALSYILWR